MMKKIKLFICLIFLILINSSWATTGDGINPEKKIEIVKKSKKTGHGKKTKKVSKKRKDVVESPTPVVTPKPVVSNEPKASSEPIVSSESVVTPELILSTELNLSPEPIKSPEQIIPLEPITPTVPVVNPVPIDMYSMENLSKIQNDKEVVISSFDKNEKLRIRAKFNNNDLNERYRKVFINNLFNFLHSSDAHCESKYIANLIDSFAEVNNNVNADYEVIDIFKMLRIQNYIDDIHYKILENLTNDYYSMKNSKWDNYPLKNIFKNYPEIAKNYNMNELFLPFKTFPNEVDSCSYHEFIKIRDEIGKLGDSNNTKNRLIRDLAMAALDQKIISLQTFNKIKFYSGESTINKRSIWLNDYFNIIFFAKNKMIPLKHNYNVINIEDENSFSTERVARFSKLTRRELLYEKYDENQIVLLTQVLKKASQRMGVDPDTKTNAPYIVEEYHVTKPEGNVEDVVEKIELDTQGQFTLARRQLRKDMVALQMMKSFQQVKITYEDIVMASLETGYLSLDDIEYVVKYDDLWNPVVSKSDRLEQLAFRIAGYSTFFLAPPWNVTGALALSIVEGIVASKKIDGATNDNPNEIIQ